MRTGQLAIALLTVLSSVGASGQSGGYFWWIAEVERAQRTVAATSPTFVLPGPQTAVDLKWTFKNDEGTDPVTVLPAALQSQVKMAISGGSTPISIGLEWAPVGSWVVSGQPAAVGADQGVQLQPGDWLEWNVSVTRKDGGAWSAGTYECSIDMSAALRTLTNGTLPWRGRASPQGKLTFAIGDVRPWLLAKSGQAMQAAGALANGQPLAAVEEYRRLLQIDPTDRANRARLGLALVAARQFKEGAANLEIVLPGTLDEKNSIPETLAYAYMALGDEVNATRVLRLVTPEAQMTSRLEWLRAAVRRSAR